MKKFILVLLLISAIMGLCSCESTTTETTPVPWGRPASWEGSMPGMSGASY